MNTPLDQLAHDYWEFLLAESPTRALLLGDHRYDREIEDLSREAEDRLIVRMEEFAAAAEAIEPAGLTADEQVTREVLIFEAANRARRLRHRPAEMAVNHAVGMQQSWLVTAAMFPLLEDRHAENVLVKMTKLPLLFDQAADRLREGVARGRTPSHYTTAKTVEQIHDYLALPLEEDPFLRMKPPPTYSETQAEEFRGRLATIVRDEIRPGYARYRDVIAGEVLPNARPDDRPGLCWLEGGGEMYADAITAHVTRSISAEEIHQIGLDTVAALEDEYRELGPPVLGTGDVSEMYRILRDDPAFHHTSGDDIIAECERALERGKAAIGDWFGRLPKADCRVEATTYGPTAYYQRPAADGSRPGTYFVNTDDPTRWGRFEVEAMAYHEGIPGHHLQLAISGELPDVPALRRNAIITAYAEGWGLYTERLSDEMGLYTSPLTRIGMLANDSMRACRLVVDTGLHAMGWSRQQAIDYMTENSPMSVGTIEPEVDRYIGSPGQALAYMMGRREIVELRAGAEAALGDRFDIKEFHDVVLGSGLMPLATLERVVRDWIEETEAA